MNELIGYSVVLKNGRKFLLVSNREQVIEHSKWAANNMFENACRRDALTNPQEWEIEMVVENIPGEESLWAK